MTQDPQVVLCDDEGDKVAGPMSLSDLMTDHDCPFAVGSEDHRELLDGMRTFGGITRSETIIFTLEKWNELNAVDQAIGSSSAS